MLEEIFKKYEGAIKRSLKSRGKNMREFIDSMYKIFSMVTGIVKKTLGPNATLENEYRIKAVVRVYVVDMWLTNSHYGYLDNHDNHAVILRVKDGELGLWYARRKVKKENVTYIDIDDTVKQFEQFFKDMANLNTGGEA